MLCPVISWKQTLNSQFLQGNVVGGAEGGDR